MSSETKRINVTFPVSLLEELKDHVPQRERNKFIVAATENHLKQVKLKKVVAELRQKPAWSDKDHPDLMTVEDVDNYVRRLRETAMPRSWDEIAKEADLDD